MQTHTDEHLMQIAIDVSRLRGSDFLTSRLGCVIMLDGKVIAAEPNRTKEFVDATAHAQMMAIRQAFEQTRELELRGATLYSTLQPCGMCTM
jgi:tRNA(adenine34) deaminase